MSMRSPTRVVVAVGHALLAESIELALRAAGHVARHVVLSATAGTLARVIADITDDPPDIALVDIDPGSFEGIRLVAPLSRNQIEVVALTTSPVGARWGEAVRYGASAVLSRSRPLSDILGTVDRLAAGLPVMSREQLDRLVDEWQRGQAERRAVLARLDSLTAREAEVLGQLLAGHQVRRIAADSGVSESTVRTQVKAILTKLGVTTQIGAVGRANQVGWRPPTAP
ncbi:response regulator transcription factor [Nocardioides sp. W7]|uniref:response regulator transcription factor n=1 Tax=Nocardioides sp. W7 TaxID=2931390 RepID=UPI001FD17E96|nr:response regulator transcription factor [Nocardioides sp. W7]